MVKYNYNKFTLNQLLFSGVHIGKIKKKLDTRMSPFLAGFRSNVNIINSVYTIVNLRKVGLFILSLVSFRQKVMFVNNLKKYTSSHNLNLFGQFHFNDRWIGGILTNHKKVLRNIKRRKKYNSLAELNYKFLPAFVFIFHSELNNWALQESKNLGIPVGGLLDSDSNPNDFNYVIPSNNTSIKSYLFFIHVFKIYILRGIQKECLSLFDKP